MMVRIMVGENNTSNPRASVPQPGSSQNNPSRFRSIGPPVQPAFSNAFLFLGRMSQFNDRIAFHFGGSQCVRNIGVLAIAMKVQRDLFAGSSFADPAQKGSGRRGVVHGKNHVSRLQSGGFSRSSGCNLG